MNPRVCPPFALLLASLPGCFAGWTVPLGEDEGSGSSSSVEASGTPTTGGETQPVTTGGDTGTSSPEDESGETAGTSAGETGGTSGAPVDPPLIVTRVIMPDFTDVNAFLDVLVMADHADGVRMLDKEASVELTPQGPGVFAGQIPAFTAIDNGQYTAWFTPWRDVLEGEAASFNYVIALPPSGDEVLWEVGGLDGQVAAIDLLADGSPVEFGTTLVMGEPRCYLQLRDKDGHALELLPVLSPAHCKAVDLAVDRETGALVVLVERKSGDDVVWWAGEIPAWGLGANKVASGEAGDVGLALARRPGLTAVCGAKAVASGDKLDALAVLIRPGVDPEERLFDHRSSDTDELHLFGETARDCTFSDDRLVLVGEAFGQHDNGNPVTRDRLMVIEYDFDNDGHEIFVAGPGPGVQARALAVDVDEDGRYHIAGTTCLDECVPEGDVRVYWPGGVLDSQVPLGQLGSSLFGPHDIAWSPAGYAVVALGGLQGPDTVFKVQAYAPNKYEPLWTFFPSDQQGIQMALAVAVGPFGEVYAGGVAKGRPVFVRIGS